MPSKKPGGAGPKEGQPQEPAKNEEVTVQKAVKAHKPSLKVKGFKSQSGKGTPPEVQAVIIAALLSGQFATDEEVAAQAGVTGSTVNRLKKKIPPEYLQKAAELKKDIIGEKVLSFLENALDSLVRIDNVTMHESWLLKQDAPGLATLYGVKADKVIKILEAIERANEPAELESASEDD